MSSVSSSSGSEPGSSGDKDAAKELIALKPIASGAKQEKEAIQPQSAAEKDGKEKGRTPESKDDSEAGSAADGGSSVSNRKTRERAASKAFKLSSESRALQDKIVKVPTFPSLNTSTLTLMEKGARD